MEDSRLSIINVPRRLRAINKAFFVGRSIPMLALLYYRVSSLIFSSNSISVFPWFLMSISEFFFIFLWLLDQAFSLQPISRTVFPENISKELPPIDVYICTANPEKEPILNVMNTVVSSMALDYPSEKLTVYLSDDAGSPFTLSAIKEAALFAKSWILFCRKYKITTLSPELYFGISETDRAKLDSEFVTEEDEIKEKYNVLKQQVENLGKIITRSSNDRASYIEMIHEQGRNVRVDDDHAKMPNLVYVAREKSQGQPHHYKAGALNVLLRVSGVISNSPYILVLDCDMYCNNPSSARQAMCFHLDTKITSSLAFVQFPQRFYNLSKNDLYDSQMRTTFKRLWQGMDGIQGPVLSGTGFYLKRRALYSGPEQRKDIDLHQLKANFGSSNKLISSLQQDVNTDDLSNGDSLHEAQVLASCTYENDTQWGKQVGFLYQCMLESTFTGYYLHSKGWTSTYLYPSNPAFLGCPPTSMNEALVQGMKWMSELFRMSISKFSPFTYGLTSRMSILQTMCYGYFMISPLYFLPMSLYALVPQLCLLSGTPVYPKVSNPWFIWFAIHLIGCLGHHLYEVLTTGASFKAWWNEVRMGMIRSVTANIFGCIDAIMKAIGIKKMDLTLTNKAVDEDQLEKYKKDDFDFQGDKIFIVPLVILVLLNTVSFIGGVGRVIIEGSYDEMFGQIFLSFFILVASYPIIEGIVTGKKNETI